MTKISGLKLALVSLIFGGVSFQPTVAQDAPPAAVAPRPGAPERAPDSPSDRGIRHISGGVGLDERAEMEALSSQYNLRLIFASQGSGEYLSAVQVKIEDAQGKTLLTAESKGPWFFAQLPTGNYVVEVVAPPEAQQRPQRKTIHVGASRQSRLSFYWR